MYEISMKYTLIVFMMFTLPTAFANDSKCLGPSVKSKQKLVQDYHYTCTSKNISNEKLTFSNNITMHLSSWSAEHQYINVKLQHPSTFKSYSSAQDYVTYLEELFQKLKPNKNNPDTIEKIQYVLKNIPDKKQLSKKLEKFPTIIDYQNKENTDDVNIVFDREQIAISISMY